MLLEYQGQDLADAVVRFTADWCQPCKVYEPIFNKVAAETDVEFYTIDVEKHPELAYKVRLQMVPTLYAVRDGAWLKMPHPPTESTTRQALELIEN